MALRRTALCLAEKKIGTAKVYYDQSNGFLRKIIPMEYMEVSWRKHHTVFSPNLATVCNPTKTRTRSNVPLARPRLP